MASALSVGIAVAMGVFVGRGVGVRVGVVACQIVAGVLCVAKRIGACDQAAERIIVELSDAAIGIADR